MGIKTEIAWTDSTWNCVRGCSRVSTGCVNCYAEKIAARFSDPGAPFQYFADRSRSGSQWTGRVELIEDKLYEPRSWRKPRLVFVNSMSDLFHENLPFEEIDRVFSVMAGCRKHTFQILTKRPERMLAYMQRFKPDGRGWITPNGEDAELAHCPLDAARWPIPNIWLGVSVENRDYKSRIYLLRQVPAALRFLSIEPLLEDISTLDLRGIGWVIAGGESGPGARPAHPQWFRGVRDQCVTAGVPFFFKQWGEWRGGDRVSGPDGKWPDNQFHDWDGHAFSVRIGKKKAGASLDGREWRQMPRWEHA